MAIQVKTGRLARVPQTQMIVDGIWPPALLPLFLKDGTFPDYVDAETILIRPPKSPQLQTHRRWRRASSVFNVTGGLSRLTKRKMSTRQRSISTTSFSIASGDCSVPTTPRKRLLYSSGQKITVNF